MCVCSKLCLFYVDTYSKNLCISYVLMMFFSNIKGAMSDRIEDIRKGYLILLPVLDEQGRAVIYFDPSLMEDKVDEVRTTQ